MELEWDENKRLRLLENPDRKVDLLEAALIFEGKVHTAEDNRKDYGEPRFRSLGEVDGQYFCVVHTPRGEKTRLITAWRVSRDDFARYQISEPCRTAGDEEPE